ncbi:MAG: hypothetical protein KGI27_14035 [Thaumarchaeota archaeon]|nr:hypothetical protein [Nitrososphaerota archaeon]
MNYFEEKEAREILTLENIRNIDGKTLSEFEKELAKDEERLFQWKKYEANTGGGRRYVHEIMSGICFSCNGFANLHCWQCKTWSVYSTGETTAGKLTTIQSLKSEFYSRA